jgi:hypothetical protein
MRRHVRSWHETDLSRCPQFGRYRRDSGHGGYEHRLPSLTPIRKSRAGNPDAPSMLSGALSASIVRCYRISSITSSGQLGSPPRLAVAAHGMPSA